jgi:small-conductance mechanosensitive channel
VGDYLEQFRALYESLRAILPNVLHPYITPALIVIVTVLAGLLVRQLVVKQLQRLSKATRNPYDDIITRLLYRKSLFWFLLLAFSLAIPEMPWRRAMMQSAQIFVLAVFIISLAIAIGRGLSALAPLYASKTGTGLSGTTLIKYILQFLIYALGATIILSLFDISIAPAITALGIGGLAVALAFQDTLSNVFAGIAITLSQHLRIGDYVQLESGEEGFVHDISWRYTVIRSFSNNLVIVPNKKMADTVLTNYHLPDAHLRIDVTVTVGYDCDLKHVEEILLDVAAQSVGMVKGVLAEPVPAVRFKEFGDSGVLTKLFVTLDDFNQKYLATHELMKYIHARFAEEGITIPYPMRVVRLVKGEEGEPRTIENQRP